MKRFLTGTKKEPNGTSPAQKYTYYTFHSRGNLKTPFARPKLSQQNGGSLCQARPRRTNWPLTRTHAQLARPSKQPDAQHRRWSRPTPTKTDGHLKGPSAMDFSTPIGYLLGSANVFNSVIRPDPRARKGYKRKSGTKTEPLRPQPSEGNPTRHQKLKD